MLLMQLASPFCLFLVILVQEAAGGSPLFGKATPSSLQQLRKRFKSEDPKALSYLVGPDVELKGWLSEASGDVDKAYAKARAKASWRKSVGRVTMSDCARGFNSDGFSLCLGGLRDMRGRPIVYSHGLPRGSEKQIRSMTVYMQERVLEACAARRGGVSVLTVIDCTKPSFRSPDRALRNGGIDVVAKYYPWNNKGTTVFVGVPPAMKFIFKVAKPFFPKDMYDRFRFVEYPEGLTGEKYIAPNQLPRSLGGTSNWNLRYYVQRRCLLEGTLCKLPPNDL